MNRKIRVCVDRTLASLLQRETVGLIELESPRDPFTEAATALPADRADEVAKARRTG
ncbi:hypothetical protein ACFZAR_22435 [Streptomyces sp. NPDC008222]|uniref:hypothetical protein n=1 Tax=Streptomyces sp. NPDC008222 TaxID=3364820 RepID=UPI0036E102C6